MQNLEISLLNTHNILPDAAVEGHCLLVLWQFLQLIEIHHFEIFEIHRVTFFVNNLISLFTFPF